jgi:hypothetical protein
MESCIDKNCQDWGLVCIYEKCGTTKCIQTGTDNCTAINANAYYCSDWECRWAAIFKGSLQDQ